MTILITANIPFQFSGEHEISERKARKFLESVKAEWKVTEEVLTWFNYSVIYTAESTHSREYYMMSTGQRKKARAAKIRLAELIKPFQPVLQISINQS